MGEIQMALAQQQVLQAVVAHPILFHAFQNTSDSASTVISELKLATPRKEIGRADLMRIAKAKLKGVQGAGQIKRNLVDCDAKVRAVSRSAFQATDDRSAVKVLSELGGVGVATASAILAWCFPDRWAVIDRHAWAALAKFGVVEPRTGNAFSVNEYALYSEIMRTIAGNVPCSPQKLDTWLYAFQKCGLATRACDDCHAPENASGRSN